MNDGAPVALLVEDEPQIRRFVHAALEQEGWQVTEADTLARVRASRRRQRGPAAGASVLRFGEVEVDLKAHLVSRDGHYLRIYMGHLRHKLELVPAQPRHLLTETGVGYRLVP